MCCNCNNWNPHYGFPRNHGKFWSGEETQAVRRQFRRGYSIGRIADNLGRTKQSIRDRLGIGFSQRERF